MHNKRKANKRKKQSAAADAPSATVFGGLVRPGASVLLVGEGDFTFGAGLATMMRRDQRNQLEIQQRNGRAPGGSGGGGRGQNTGVDGECGTSYQIVATGYDSAAEVRAKYGEVARRALRQLSDKSADAESGDWEMLAVEVMHDVDATRLEECLVGLSPTRRCFDVVWWNFPHVGSGDNVEANRADGFRLAAQAQAEGWVCAGAVPFDPTAFPGYTPVRTRPSMDPALAVSAPDTAGARLHIFAPAPFAAASSSSSSPSHKGTPASALALAAPSAGPTAALAAGPSAAAAAVAGFGPPRANAACRKRKHSALGSVAKEEAAAAAARAAVARSATVVRSKPACEACDVCGVGPFGTAARRNAHFNSPKHARRAKAEAQRDRALARELAR